MKTMFAIILIFCVQNAYASLDVNETYVWPNGYRYSPSNHHYIDRSGFSHSCRKNCECDWPTSDGTFHAQQGCKQPCCALADRLKLTEISENHTNLKRQLEKQVNETQQFLESSLASKLDLERKLERQVNETRQFRESSLVTKLKLEDKYIALIKEKDKWKTACIIVSFLCAVLFAVVIALIYILCSKFPQLRAFPKILNNNRASKSARDCRTDIGMESEKILVSDLNGEDDAMSKMMPVYLSAPDEHTNKVEVAEGNKGALSAA